MDPKWLVLAYTLPPEPSRKRVSAWRRLRKVGAVYLEEGIWFLPAAAGEDRLAEVVADIESEGGTAWSFEADEMSDDRAALLALRYNSVRTEEYEEVNGHCRRFLAHVERVTAAGDYRLAKLDELEQDLEKRARLLTEVEERDVLHSPGHEPAETMVHECRRALELYAEAVFLNSGATPPG
jgi:hypothetical protein